jgi:PAT family beta-lactamase induction signal transducer AmpG
VAAWGDDRTIFSGRTETTALAEALAPPRAPPGRLALYLLLGFSAGLPFYMFSTVLALRLAKHGVGLVMIGFFAWVTLLPTFKWAWAPLLDRYDVPGFARFWGKRRGWIMLSQLGIFLSMTAMAFTAADRSLAMTALFAVLLAFWTTTLEVSADAWRIELAPTQEEQGPLVAANLWGYRSAMVAAGSGSLIVADVAGWTWGYLAIAAAAFLPFPILAAMRPDQHANGNRMTALLAGLIASLIILLGTAAATAGIGWAALRAAAHVGISDKTNATLAVLILCLIPFGLLALALPWIRRLPPTAKARTSAAIGPYVDLFWRFGYAALPVLGFVAVYRMGDVLTLAMSKPLENAAHYSLSQIGWADGWVALPASMIGVAIGGWIAARYRLVWMLVVGAACSAIGNWIFVWLWYQPPSNFVLTVATALDQFAHGLEGAVFVVYLSMLVNPRYPGAQYAFLSGFAFLLPRLVAGAGGSIQAQIGYDGFFWLSGTLSAAAVLFLPFIANVKPRHADA